MEQMQNPQQPETATPAQGGPKRKPVIRIEKMGVTYFPGRSNEVKALQDINLEIYPGEYIIFFGPSGCGKSTLLYSIAGLERNIDGDIWVDDSNLSRMTLNQVEEYHQRTIGMIFQSYYLIPSLSVVENVALPQVAIKGRKADRLAKAGQLLEQFGVGAQARKLPTELSGGQQQRVAICRSLMNDSDILVADEPVGNLDSKSSSDVMDLLRYLNDVQKKTVILVTHDPSHLHHAHRVFYLRDGRVIDTKVNTEEERTVSPVTAAAQIQAAGAVAMTHWIRAYADQGASSKSQEAVGTVQHIVAETLTGMTIDELVGIETKMYDIIRTGSQHGETIYKFLKKIFRKGGVSMPATKAKHLSHTLQSLARGVRHLYRPVSAAGEEDAREYALPLSAFEARSIRRALLDSLDIQLRSLRAADAMDDIIQRRLEGKIDAAGAHKAFSTGEREGGPGLTPALARAVSRRLESIACIKPVPPASPPPAAPPPPPPHEND